MAETVVHNDEGIRVMGYLKVTILLRNCKWGEVISISSVNYKQQSFTIKNKQKNDVLISIQKPYF